MKETEQVGRIENCVLITLNKLLFQTRETGFQNIVSVLIFKN